MAVALVAAASVWTVMRTDVVSMGEGRVLVQGRHYPQPSAFHDADGGTIVLDSSGCIGVLGTDGTVRTVLWPQATRVGVEGPAPWLEVTEDGQRTTELHLGDDVSFGKYTGLSAIERMTVPSSCRRDELIRIFDVDHTG
ncbi:hypothetical protein [Nocardioides aurantiacus]|nr:hypothetical protein [Nocardioides aurantiacus]